MKSEGVGLIVRAISFQEKNKISNLCGHDPPTLHTDHNDTVRWTNGRYARLRAQDLACQH